MGEQDNIYSLSMDLVVRITQWKLFGDEHDLDHDLEMIERSGMWKTIALSWGTYLSQLNLSPKERVQLRKNASSN